MPEKTPARNEAETRCRDCGFVLGRLLRDREHAQFTPGVSMIVTVADQGSQTELICPRCGERRPYTDVTFVAMAVPFLPELHRAKIGGDTQV